MPRVQQLLGQVQAQEGVATALGVGNQHRVGAHQHLLRSKRPEAGSGWAAAAAAAAAVEPSWLQGGGDIGIAFCVARSLLCSVRVAAQAHSRALTCARRAEVLGCRLEAPNGLADSRAPEIVELAACIVPCASAVRHYHRSAVCGRPLSAWTFHSALAISRSVTSNRSEKPGWRQRAQRAAGARGVPCLAIKGKGWGQLLATAQMGGQLQVRGE